MSRTFATAIVLAVTTTLGVTGVAAQESAPTPPSSLDQAREASRPLFERGLGLVVEQRWSEALDSFLQAYEMYQTPILLFNIGFCQRALGQYVAARQTLRRFVDAELTGVAAARRRDAEAYLRELDARIAKLTVTVPASLRAGIEVVVDGRATEVPESGVLDIVLDPGPHTIQARHEGYAPLFVDRALAPGAEEVVGVELERLPARLIVASNVPDATVLLDGDAIGTAPLDSEIPPGRFSLEVEADGYVAHRSDIAVAPGDVARVRANLSEAPTPITARWWFWTGIGVLVAGAAAVTYILVRPEPEAPPYDGGTLDWVVNLE